MLQGSGWGWLGYNKANGALEVATCANQDPLSTKVGSTWGERCARKAVQCRHGGV
jgi:superoxide dismutase